MGRKGGRSRDADRIKIRRLTEGHATTSASRNCLPLRREKKKDPLLKAALHLPLNVPPGIRNSGGLPVGEGMNHGLLLYQSHSIVSVTTKTRVSIAGGWELGVSARGTFCVVTVQLFKQDARDGKARCELWKWM